MSAPLWIIVAAVVVVVLVGLGLMLWIARRSRLRALPPQSRDRYAASWRAIEARFIDQPQDAVREADRLAQEMLRERGARMDGRQLPDQVRRARAVAESGDGRTETEAMRRAMLRYREIVAQGVGDQIKRTRAGRREVAS
jgi:hypothetical protein